MLVISEYPIKVVFYRTETNNEPVRKWLKELSRSDRKIIGEDIKTVQFGWPLGMPLVKKVDVGLWKIRSKLDNKISRVIFTIYNDLIVLLHGFIKKSQKIPTGDLNLAKNRLQILKGNLSKTSILAVILMTFLKKKAYFLKQKR